MKKTLATAFVTGTLLISSAGMAAAQDTPPGQDKKHENKACQSDKGYVLDIPVGKLGGVCLLENGLLS